MSLRLYALFAAVVLAPAVAAHADTLSTFDIAGQAVTYNMAGDVNTVTGTMTIDTTSGVLEAISLTAGGLSVSGVDFRYDGGTFYLLGSPSDSVFSFSGTTLVGYMGSTFNLRTPNDEYVGDTTLVALADPTSVTPEPSSMLLLGSGLFGVAAMSRRRIA